MPTAPHHRQPIALRTDLRPGDIGTIIRLHAVLYTKEYGWDHTFEGYVAESLAEFALAYDPARDRLWLAERDGEIVGSIGVVHRPNKEAQLRWLLVDPAARGQGLGRRLLDEALAFCRNCGYRSAYLWTVSKLDAAVHLYHTLGFERTEQETHDTWGETLTEERYDISL
jgi:ribosomal protein S18 acetylase RimI-like enzyme